MSTTPARHDDVKSIAAIDDPVRRALFDVVRRSASPVSRDAAAEALDLPRSTAAFHLDRLVDAGLLEPEFRRLSGRSGPGSGRPSKLYRVARFELSVSIPARQYVLVGDLLATAVIDADRTGVPPREALADIAREEGKRLGAEAASLASALERGGYEPEDDGAGGMRLRNCPFHALASKHTELICHANLCLLEGAVDGAGDIEHTARFAPQESECCVHLERRAEARES